MLVAELSMTYYNTTFLSGLAFDLEGSSVLVQKAAAEHYYAGKRRRKRNSTTTKIIIGLCVADWRGPLRTYTPALFHCQ